LHGGAPRPDPRGRHEAGGVVDVLERDRHAVKRPHESPVARLDVPLDGDAGGGIAVEEHPGLEDRLDRVDALEAGGQEV